MVLLIGRLFLELLPKKSSGAELVDKTHLLCLHGRERLFDIAYDDPSHLGSLLSNNVNNLGICDQCDEAVNQLGL
ncbi:hypothetical protein Tco_0375385 [Tanacetum coccineum]